MRVRTILTLATLVLTCFTVAVWSSPLTSGRGIGPTDSASLKGSVSGKISSIGDASFSVAVKRDQEVVMIEFLVDDNTKVDGKLKIGSVATVDYRTDDGNNIAGRVVAR